MNPKTPTGALLLPLSLAVACAGTASAQTHSAVVALRVTLPFEARWGSEVLPAGSYSFTVDTLGRPHLLGSRGGPDAAAAPLVTTAGPEDRGAADDSALIVVRRAGRYTIRALHLCVGDLRLDAKLLAPHAETALAQAPQLIQRVPISIVAQ